jgi:hypothetical protein
MRVVRGWNWEWDTQDGGEGFVGTVKSWVAYGEKINRQKYLIVTDWDNAKRQIVKARCQKKLRLLPQLFGIFTSKREKNLVKIMGLYRCLRIIYFHALGLIGLSISICLLSSQRGNNSSAAIWNY